MFEIFQTPTKSFVSFQFKFSRNYKIFFQSLHMLENSLCTNFAAVPTSNEFWDDIKGTSQKAKSLVHCGIECYQQKKKFENCVAIRFVDGVCEMATSYPILLPQSSSSIKVSGVLL